MRWGDDLFSDPGRARAREWLVTNGRGGFAAGTAAGIPTRASHGLLFASRPDGRLSVLARVEERMPLSGSALLDVHAEPTENPEAPAPPALEPVEFALDPWPSWRMRAGDSILERSLLLVDGHDAVVLHYRLVEGPAVRLLLTPLFDMRAEDALRTEDAEVGGVSHMIPGRVRFELYSGLPSVTLWHNAGGFVPARAWYRELELAADGVREDAFAPGHLQGTLAPGRPLHLVVAIEEELFRVLAAEGRLGTPPASSLGDCVRALEEEERVRGKLATAAALSGMEWTSRQAAGAHRGDGADAPPPAPDDVAFAERLAAIADAFVIRRPRGAGIAGSYPGRADRTLEALMALPGLLLTTRRFAEARELLEEVLSLLDDGFLPERLDDPAGGRAGAEATMWLVHAGDLYVRRSEDEAFLHETLFPALEGAMQYFRSGTRGVGVDRDGLLAVAGEEADAPARRPVGLNALWFHALAALSAMARQAGRPEHAAFYTAWAREHQRAFNDAFWCEAQGCCYAALDGDHPDETLDAAQVLAVSLPPVLLSTEHAARALDAIEQRLLTPLGLRPTAPAPRRARRKAPPVSTAEPASPWLLAHFAAGVMRVQQWSPQSRAQARTWLEPLRRRVLDGDSLPRSFDPEPPHAPHGAAFAPSVGELLRVGVEEVGWPVGAAAETGTSR